jgi:uncharacterized protein (TIGR02271 family)
MSIESDKGRQPHGDADQGESDEVEVRLQDGRTFYVDRSLLRPAARGTPTLRADRDELAAARAPASSQAAAPIVVPVVEERVELETRRRVTGKVRVSTHAVTSEETVDLPLTQEQVDVRRVPIGRQVDAAVQPRQEGDTWIIPVMEEVLVVEKRLVLREEIHLTTRRNVTHTPQTVSLLHTEVTIDRLPGDRPT